LILNYTANSTEDLLAILLKISGFIRLISSLGGLAVWINQFDVFSDASALVSRNL